VLGVVFPGKNAIVSTLFPDKNIDTYSIRRDY
jgi:hypothetical protein